jgi:putative MATE family efflux protein
MLKPAPLAAAAQSASRNSNVDRAIDGPIPSVLLSFSGPSLLQILVQSGIAVFEILLLSRLGTDTLAGISAVFPITTLLIAVTTLGLGGAVASAIARALGAGNREEAEALAMHAIVLAVAFGIATTVILVGFGPRIYAALGARNAALDRALAYSNILFGGAIGLWLLGSLTAIVRGAGDMRTPARIAIYRALLALPLFAILIFGWGPVPAFGVAGSAAAMLTYYALGVIAMIVHLQSGKSSVRLTWSGLRPQWPLFVRILKVASPSSLQLLVTNVALLAITAFVARFGTEALAGYGLASRLELLVSSMVLAIGVGTTTMVGINVGAGLVARARRVTFVSCGLAAAIFETLGVAVALSGGWISRLFTAAPNVIIASAGYFRAVGLVYGFMAASVILFSAYQGWGKSIPPLIVSLLRVTLMLCGGWLLMQQAVPRLDLLYALIAGATALGAIILGTTFVLWPPIRTQKPVSG